MKRYYIIFGLFIVSAFFLGGCSEKITNLSEKNSDLVAEYSAGVLLRYSDRYEYRLITKKDIERAKARNEYIETPTGSASSEVTPSPSPSPSPSPEPEVNNGSQEGNQESTNNQNDSKSNQAENDSNENATGGVAEEKNEKEVSLTEFYGITGLKFDYKNYEFCSQYPKNSSTISPMRAKSNETLLVVKFNIKNLSSQKKKVNLLKESKNIDYVLNVDGATFKPGINILDNMGLNFLDTSLKAGKNEEAALIYTMDKSRKKASAISLKISKGDRVVNIKIK